MYYFKLTIMRKEFLFFIVVILISFISCKKDDNESTKNTGLLKGSVGLYEGNCMPSPGVSPCEPSPISTTVAITQPSRDFNLDLLIDSVVASENGEFEINLTEGIYSVFLRDGNDFVCDSWSCSDECHCTLIKITNDSTTNIYINIDHATW